MSSILKTWTPERVAGAKEPVVAFAGYASQTIGIPTPTIKDMTILRKKCKEFFAEYPHCDWYTMCRIVQWAKARKKRFARVWMLVARYREAWSANFIPELENTDREDIDVEAGIARALEVEERVGWRRRLTMTSGAELRRGVLLEWQTEQQSSRSGAA